MSNRPVPLLVSRVLAALRQRDQPLEIECTSAADADRFRRLLYRHLLRQHIYGLTIRRKDNVLLIEPPSEGPILSISNEELPQT